MMNSEHGGTNGKLRCEEPENPSRSHDYAAIISGKWRLVLSFFQKLSGGKFHTRFMALQFVLLHFIRNCAANMLSFKLKKAKERWRHFLELS